MIKAPSKSTVRNYGLTIEEWFDILKAQGNVCAICKKEPSTGRLCVDHQHIPGWKKMPPEQKKVYVRGILCWYCNSRLVGKGVTLEKAKNIVDYLESYEAKKLQELSKSMPSNLLKKE